MAKNKVPRFIAFTTLTYTEDVDWDKAISNCMRRGYPVAYCIHDKDRYLNPEKLPDGKKLGDLEKSHCQTLIRLSSAQTVSAFSKNCGVPENHIRGLNSWRAFAIYLVHRDNDSIAEGKHQYNYSDIHGNYREEVINVLKNEKAQNYNKSREDENSIMDIVNYIESFSCSIPTSQVVQWASESGLYSVYRRSASIIANILKEHNMSCQHSVAETLMDARIKLLESRLTEAEKELERAYGDFFQRSVNPWTGKCVERNVEYVDSIRKLNQSVNEILKKA